MTPWRGLMLLRSDGSFSARHVSCQLRLRAGATCGRRACSFLSCGRKCLWTGGGGLVYPLTPRLTRTRSLRRESEPMPEKRSLFLRAALACVVLLSLSFAAAAQEQQATPQTQTPTPTPESPGDETTAVKSFERLEWRSIGPANMGGRIADIEGVAGNPNLVYVATASGGLFKTTNGGAKWTPVFERQGSISIGDIALEPGNPDVIWLGAGESAVRNSVSFGDGVYKSTDGGQTWRRMGLRDTEHVSKILINPRNPDIVFVGAQGHASRPNEERGVFMTTDGGKTWNKTLYLDPEHGVADMDIDPSNPNIVYAVMWKFRRTPWGHTSGDEKGGLFRSIDGGRTWKKLEGGLPKVIGRIGVD